MHVPATSSALRVSFGDRVAEGARLLRPAGMLQAPLELPTSVFSPYRLHASRQNRLLEVLPPPLWQRLAVQLELVELAPGTVLFEGGAAPAEAWFPTSAVLAVVQMLEDGATPEIAVVGCEGMVDVAAYMGGTSQRCIVQLGGCAFRLPAAALAAAFDESPALRRLLLRYAQALLAQLAQTAVCNRHHALEQQLCRWLLQRLDRLPDATLLLTHEAIAAMLAVRREGVTEALGRLQRLGAIRCRRGRIVVLERRLLEARACECYATVARETGRLLPDRIAV
jgi:CRP-like cAMP-binding protein